MVWPKAKVAAVVPVLFTVMVQVQLLPRVPAPLTLLALVAVRSTAVATTVSLQELFPSLLSGATLFGSTPHEPPPRGLAKVPAALAVAVNWTAKVPVVAPTVTVAPLAVQVRLLLAMAQLMLALLVTLVTLTTL